MRLSDDISRQIGEMFVGEDQSQAAALLLGAHIHNGSTAECRLQRCALVASKGSLDRLKYYVNLLAVDYRDVIVAGEYESRAGKLVRVRNLTGPF